MEVGIRVCIDSKDWSFSRFDQGPDEQGTYGGFSRAAFAGNCNRE